MSKNFILGSGLTGLLAKFAFPKYSIIPFGRSRFYGPTINLGGTIIPLGDNNIVRNEKADVAIRELGFNTTYEYYPTAISYSGELTFNKRLWSQIIVDKLYTNDPHPFAAKLLSDDSSSYQITALELYNNLLTRYRSDVVEASKRKVDRITKDEIIFNDGSRTEYDKILNTIPLDALLDLMNVPHQLKSADYHVYLMATKSFNLEGAKRCFIGDLTIPFWKVNIINPEIYQFYSNGEVGGADAVFRLLTGGSYKHLADTIVRKAFPLGPPPLNITEDLKSQNIICVGQLARWDYFADITTSIIDLTRV
jgi:hypothetical protein